MNVPGLALSQSESARELRDELRPFLPQSCPTSASNQHTQGGLFALLTCAASCVCALFGVLCTPRVAVMNSVSGMRAFRFGPSGPSRNSTPGFEQADARMTVLEVPSSQVGA